MKKLILIIAAIAMLTSCQENYSNGSRVGYVLKFSKKGLFYKTWEGDLNMTQMGNNTSYNWDFSIDGAKEDPQIVQDIQAALDSGWRVKLYYHQVKGTNIANARGETDYFVSKCEVLKK